MPLIYSVVARGVSILAKHAACAGNFDEVTEQILIKIPLHNEKMTYSQGPYLFHYVSDNQIVYMCITDNLFQRSRAFLFLNEVKRRFVSMYGDGALTALPYAMNTEFGTVLSNEMKHYSESKDLDTISKVHGELDELKDIMVKNLNNLTQREQRLELLVHKTENLSNNSVTFRTTSRNLARSLFWKNVKMYVILGVIGIVIIYVILAISCGGLGLPKCVASN